MNAKAPSRRSVPRWEKQGRLCDKSWRRMGPRDRETRSWSHSKSVAEQEGLEPRFPIGVVEGKTPKLRPLTTYEFVLVCFVTPSLTPASPRDANPHHSGFRTPPTGSRPYGWSQDSQQGLTPQLASSLPAPTLMSKVGRRLFSMPSHCMGLSLDFYASKFSLLRPELLKTFLAAGKPLTPKSNIRPLHS